MSLFGLQKFQDGKNGEFKNLSTCLLMFLPHLSLFVSLFFVITIEGKLSGNMVVSMKPIKAVDIAKHVDITSKFPHAHGGPVCVGCPQAIGVSDVMKPDYGDAVAVELDEVPVFHACGVTPQNILMASKVEFAITHSPGHMFITDLPCDQIV